MFGKNTGDELAGNMAIMVPAHAICYQKKAEMGDWSIPFTLGHQGEAGIFITWTYGPH